MYLDITNIELNTNLEEIVTFLGGYDIEVDLTKEEVLISLRYALMKFEKETSVWQLKNQFLNTYGQLQGQVMSNQLATINFGFVQQITDWFATMARVGGKIPWHKDYFYLQPGRQIYYLDKESSKPYQTGSRRIHRVMWYARPEIFNSGHYNDLNQNGDDVLYSNSWNFSNNGLNYGNNRLGFLGYAFDTMLMMQSMETRNKLFFSEFYHNLSGDVLELTPTPTGPASQQGVTPHPGSRVFYYYWNEEELLAGRPLDKFFDGQEVIDDPNNPNSGNGLSSLAPGSTTLIANPLQMQLDMVNWSSLSPWAKAFVKDMAFCKCKYIQGSKWRKIQKTMTGGEMNSWEVTFDYASLLSEASSEEATLVENLRKDLDELNIFKLTENQKSIVSSAREINKNNTRLWKFM